MRKAILYVFLLFTLKTYSSNFVYVPDSIFRNYISTIAPGAISGDSMDITNQVVTTIDSVNISGLGISNIEGIEYFDSLRVLEAGYNNIALVSALPARLSLNGGIVNLTHNSIGSITYTNNYAIAEVYSLDVSYNLMSGSFNYYCFETWTSLNISHNNLTSINVTYNLQFLDCSYNQLTAIAAPCSYARLVYLNCSYNQIANINQVLSVDPIVTLYCQHNHITTLSGFPSGLKLIDCSSNELNTEPSFNEGLQYLNIDSNFLYVLDSVPTSMLQLYCQSNHIFDLGSLPDSLQIFDCRSNALLCLPSLPDSLQQLLAAQNFISCLPNLPDDSVFTSDVAYNQGTYTICNTNNCNDYATISGYAFIDLNNNGVRDSTDPPLINHIIYIQPLLQSTLTDSNGFYSFNSHPGIVEKIWPDSLDYTVYRPDSIAVLLNMPSADSSNLNFGFHYLDTFSDVAVFATEVIEAMPGQVAEYNLALQNLGARQETGILYFIFDSIFTFNGATPPITAISGDTLKWSFSNFQLAGQINYRIYLNTPDSAILGTIFNDTAFAAILNHDSFPANNVAVITDSIVGNYQRNNKTVTPQIYTGANFQAGDYFDYTITFQNTGNANVSHVWIIDTLNANFDMNSLVIVAASASYSLTVDGNVLRVDFNNINLPDSAASSIASHGFFRFKIRPLAANLVTNIRNTAYIYFDGVGFVTGVDCSVCLSIMHISVQSEPVIIQPCGENPILGSAQVASVNGSAPYTYTWNNGVTNSLDTGLHTGYYYVTVTDNCATTAVGITYVDSEIVYQQFLTEQVYVSNVTCYGLNNGAIALNACGYPPLTFQWSNGATAEDIINLAPGTYSYTITDGHGGGLISQVQVQQPDAPLASGLSYTSCSNGGMSASASVSPSGGTYPYSALWSTGVYAYEIDSLASGYYSVTVTDANSCTASANFTILPVSNIEWTEFDISYDCQGNWDLNYATSGAAWVTINGNNYPVNGHTSGSNTEIYAEAGVPTDCFIDTTISVIPYPPLVVSISTLQNIFCTNMDGTGTLLASASGGTGAYNFQWSNSISENDGSDSSIDSNLIAGYYNCFVFDDTLGCAVYAEYTFQQLYTLALTDTVINNACFNDFSGQIWASPSGGVEPYYYYWAYVEFPGDVFSGDSINGLLSGTYTITITDANGCTVSIDSIIVNQPSEPLTLTSSFTNSTCYYQPNGTIIPVVWGGWGSYTFLWSTGATDSILSQLSAGKFTCTVTDANGCVISDSVSITQSDSFDIIVKTTKSTCFDSVKATIGLLVSGNSIYTYQWNTDATTDSISVTGGNYFWTVTDAGGCSVSESVIIPPADSFIVASQVINTTCFDSSNGSIHLFVSGNSGGYTYNWSNNATGTTNNFLAADTYGCTITDSSGCSVIQLFAILRPDSVKATILSSEPKCGFDSGFIKLNNISGGTPPYNIAWNNGDTGIYANSLPPGIYCITIIDDKGCTYTLSDTLNCITGIGEALVRNEFSLYPNPADKYLYVEMDMQGNYEFDLLNENGQVIDRKQTRQVDDFDTQSLAGGVYFIRVIDRTTNTITANRKVIIVH